MVSKLRVVWDKLLKCPGHENLSMVKELHANWNDHMFTSWIRGIEVPLDRESLRIFLRVDCQNPKIFPKLLKCPS